MSTLGTTINTGLKRDYIGTSISLCGCHLKTTRGWHFVFITKYLTFKLAFALAVTSVVRSPFMKIISG